VSGIYSLSYTEAKSTQSIHPIVHQNPILEVTTMTIVIRPGTNEDLFDAFVIFQLALHGLQQSMGEASPEDKPNPDELDTSFAYFRMFTEYFTETAEHFWVAEEDGELIGFSRSMERDGVRQLSEFFVHPNRQAQGVGKRLLEAAFSPNGEPNRVVIGTSDIRALTRYLKSGVKFRFTIYDWWREPEIVPVETDLAIEPFQPTPENLTILNSIDRLSLAIHAKWTISGCAGTVRVICIAATDRWWDTVT
jgi:GNAT superfamily N-acetyltransferase